MRVAVLSDIHSNLVALQAVLGHVGSVDAVWHLGDIVGYGPDPDGVVARLAEVGAVGVLGNHDAAALGGPEIEWFNPDARAAAEWTRDTITAATRTWLDDLPLRREIGPMTLVHGSPRDPLREYVSSLGVARASLASLTTRYGLHGHTHVPVAFVDAGDSVGVLDARDGTTLALDERTTLLNPGSVGQPRDGDPRAAYLVLDTDDDAVTWHRVRYDVAPVQAAIRAAGLPPRLADRLAVGA
ncbi:MAG: metallophosphatase family protein [Chloroflexota bacterium]|nr:metallophosphatase family protein [Chloroflexota bacterium]MDH5244033.1 metallophosphatase family protein [Chloroflexota bacterium]